MRASAKIVSASLLLLGFAATAHAGEGLSFTGTFTRECTSERDSICFELNVTQTGSRAHIEFMAAFGDGHSVVPDGDGDGSVSPTGVLSFHWQDSFFNEGTGTLTPKGKFYVLSMYATKVAERRPLQLYPDPDPFSLIKKSASPKHR